MNILLPFGATSVPTFASISKSGIGGAGGDGWGVILQSSFFMVLLCFRKEIKQIRDSAL